MNIAQPLATSRQVRLTIRRHTRKVSLFFFLHTAIRLLTVARIYAIAHVLMPEHVGVASVIFGVVTLMSSLTRPGIITAMVQSQRDVSPYLNALWTLNLLRGLALTLAALVIGYGVLTLLDYGASALPYLLAVAVCLPLDGLRNLPGAVLVTRERGVHKTALLTAVQTAAEFAALLALLMAFRNTWALIGAFAANTLAYTAASYWVFPYRPRLDLRLGKLREFYAFGRWTQATNTITTATSRLDVFILGKLLDPASVGLYSMTQSVATMPKRHLMNPVREYLMPTLARLQNRPERMRIVVLAAGAGIAIFAATYSLSCVFFAPWIVQALMGDKWLAAVPVFQALTVAMGLRMFDTLFVALFDAAGCPSRSTLSGAIFSAILLLLMAALVPFHGLMGAAWAFMGACVVGFGVNLCMAVRILRWPGPTHPAC